MWPQPFLFAARNEPLHLAGREALVVDRVVFEQPFDQAELVVGVDDLEVLRQAGVLPMGAQQPVGNGVEGADPHVAHGDAQQRFQARAHFARRFIGKRHRQQRVRRQPLGLHQPGNAVNQHAGFTGARARQYQ